MSEEIITILDDLSKRFGVAIDWSAENVLPYAQELFQKFVNYEIWTSVAFIVLALLGIGLFIWSIKYGIKEDILELIVFPIVGVVVLGVVICVQALDIITAITFPEKALFDYVNYMQS
jgi:hypothetical protein